MSSPPRVKTTALTDNDESQSFFAHTCTGRPVYELLGTWPGMVQETEDGGPGNHDAQARKHDLLGCTQENCTGLRRELRSPVERHNGLSDQEQQAASLRSHFFSLVVERGVSPGGTTFLQFMSDPRKDQRYSVLCMQEFTSSIGELVTETAEVHQVIADTSS